MKTNIQNKQTDMLNRTSSNVIRVDDITKYATNILPDMEKIIAVTPKDGYNKKVELIANATDMSTREKIDLLNKVDDMYSYSIFRNTKTISNFIQVEAGVLFLLIVGIGLVQGHINGTYHVNKTVA